MAETNHTGANIGFENKLWAAADKLRGHMDAAEYKHVVLGLVFLFLKFLKHISDSFQERYEQLSLPRIPSWPNCATRCCPS